MDEFVDVLNSFRHIENADTYVTGSNSHFLSSDIPTEFRGRGETIHVNPMSFAEFYSAVGGDKQDAWREYYTYGGLPLIQSFETEEKKINYLKGLFETVYLADIIERHRIKNDNELRELVLILASYIGAPCNPTKLSNTFKSGLDVTDDTARLQATQNLLDEVDWSETSSYKQDLTRHWTEMFSQDMTISQTMMEALTLAAGGRGGISTTGGGSSSELTNWDGTKKTGWGM